MSGGENVGMPMGKPPMYKTVDEIEKKSKNILRIVKDIL